MGVKVNVNFDKQKLKSAIKNQAREALQNRSYEIECPLCHTFFDAKDGENLCPHCNQTVNLKLNIKL